MSNCNCKSEIEAKLLERFIQAEPDAEGHAVELQGYALGLTANSIVIRPSMPIRLTAVRTSRAGLRRPRSSAQTMVFSFCPFCGVKFADMKATEQAQPSSEVPA